MMYERQRNIEWEGESPKSHFPLGALSNVVFVQVLSMAIINTHGSARVCVCVFVRDRHVKMNDTCDTGDAVGWLMDR